MKKNLRMLFRNLTHLLSEPLQKRNQHQRAQLNTGLRNQTKVQYKWLTNLNLSLRIWPYFKDFQQTSSTNLHIGWSTNRRNSRTQNSRNAHNGDIIASRFNF
jgi:hypothetical protein